MSCTTAPRASGNIHCTYRSLRHYEIIVKKSTSRDEGYHVPPAHPRPGQPENGLGSKACMCVIFSYLCQRSHRKFLAQKRCLQERGIKEDMWTLSLSSSACCTVLREQQFVRCLRESGFKGVYGKEGLKWDMRTQSLSSSACCAALREIKYTHFLCYLPDSAQWWFKLSRGSCRGFSWR